MKKYIEAIKKIAEQPHASIRDEPGAKGPSYKSLFNKSGRAAREAIIRNLPEKLKPHKKVIEAALKPLTEYNKEGLLAHEDPEGAAAEAIAQLPKDLHPHVIDHIVTQSNTLNQAARDNITGRPQLDAVGNPAASIGITIRTVQQILNMRRKS